MYSYVVLRLAICLMSIAGCLVSVPSFAQPLSEEELQEFAEVYKRMSSGEREAAARSIRPALQRVRGLPPELPDPKDKINKLTTTVLIRDAYAPIAYITQPSATSDNLPDNGASFSFTRNFEARTSTLAGTGAVMVSIHGDRYDPLLPGETPPRLTYVNFAPGIEFDAKAKNGKTSGSISGMFGSEFEISDDGSIIPKHYLRANAVFTTDYDQSAQIFGLETMWQPWAPLLFMSTRIRLSEALNMWFGFYPSLNMDYYQVEKVGSFSELDRKNYLWLGPKLSANLYFTEGPFKPWQFYAKYFYQYDALNPHETTLSYFQGGIKYKVMTGIALDWRYTNGTLPRTLERKNDFYTGLTIKWGELRPL